MVWEQEVKCIVMLCRTEENGKVTLNKCPLLSTPTSNFQEACARYWPHGRGSSETYGKYSVTLSKQDVFGDYAIRKFDISESQSRMSLSKAGFTVTQFHYIRWPEDGVPQSTTGVLEVANLVQKVQMSTGNKAIVVMCK